MRHPPPLPLEAHVRAAWQAQVAAAGQTPGLLPELVRRRHEVLPRFAAYYTQLRALPRRVRRALQRQLGLPLAALALWLALGQLPVQAATIPVGGACTLVDAITAANTATATGGCPAGSGADTLVLPAGSMQVLSSVHNDTYGPTGLPVISSTITIAGQGSTVTRADGAPDFRLFTVSSMGDLTLQETTVSGGAVPSGGSGGGVWNSGALTILKSTITDNSAHKGTGGGVANYGGTLTVTNSTISGNTAFAFFPDPGGSGGGMSNSDGGTVTVTNSTISGNDGIYGAGGVENFGTLTVANSTISGNGSINVGGVENRGTLTVTNSTISGNTSFYDLAGGVANFGGTLTVTNSIISGNSGGGVRNYGGTLTLTNSTISGNTRYYYGGGGVANVGSGTLILARTLVSGNTAPTGPEISNSATAVANNHNLFGVDDTAGVEGFSPGATDVVPGAGVLLPDILDPTLAFNGGRTQTHALVPGSPAIDAGGPVCTNANGDPLLTDQRGKPRLVDGDGDGIAACDIGAFEFFPLVNDFVTLDPALDTTFDPKPVLGGPAGTFTITATFTNTSDTPLRFPFFEVTALSGGNLLLNADEGVRGVGATLTPEVGDRILSPGESVAVDFVIGLQTQAPFTFFVELFGEPVL